MDKSKKEIEIPKQGNLGILAYGDIALEAWRKARGPLKIKKIKTNSEKNNNE